MKTANQEKTMTTAALAAKMLRAELKEAFKGVKFSVKSDNFAGGNAVRVSWKDGPTTKEVEQISGKYQYGYFDGMTDCYQYTNGRSDIPQVMFVSETREMSAESKEFYIKAVNELRGETEDMDVNVWRFFCNPPKSDWYPARAV